MQNGTLVLNNPNGGISFTITGKSVVTYTLTPSVTNVTISPLTAQVQSGGSQTFTLSADGTSYKLPTKITISGTEVTAGSSTEISGKCTVLFTRASDTSGSIAFSNVTDDVSFSVVGESAELTELCFTANTAGSTVELCVNNAPSIANTAYSRDRITWTTFTPSQHDTPGVNVVTLTNVGDKVYFRNDITANLSNLNRMEFVMTGSISASGNINSMYVATGFNELSTLTYEYCFYRLFRYCESLTTAPTLPATTLSPYCYSKMFVKCNLTLPPELPATTLAEGCYWGLFGRCTSLTKAPALPATTLAKWCYGRNKDTDSGMFAECTSLTTAPALPATTLAESCYIYMFKNCTSLQVSDTQTEEAQYAWNIPNSGTFTNETQCDQLYMFNSCLGTRSSDDMSGAYGESHTYYTQNPPVQ